LGDEDRDGGMCAVRFSGFRICHGKAGVFVQLVHSATVYSMALAFSSGEKYLATGSKEQTIKLKSENLWR
jgi:hypothetical protein